MSSTFVENDVTFSKDPEDEVVSGGPQEVDEERRPAQLIDRYIFNALQRAQVERLEDGTWEAIVLALPGVWAEGQTEDEARAVLADVIGGWIELKIADNDGDIPEIGDIDLNHIR
jgi:predicted RNase H-like HicB family nuclease